MWRVCAIALSFVFGWRAFSSASLCKYNKGCQRSYGQRNVQARSLCQMQQAVNAPLRAQLNCHFVPVLHTQRTPYVTLAPPCAHLQAQTTLPERFAFLTDADGAGCTVAIHLDSQEVPRFPKRTNGQHASHQLYQGICLRCSPCRHQPVVDVKHCKQRTPIPKQK
jgi:hypothetical protein